MCSENFSIDKMIDDLLDLAKENSSFDDSFVNSLAEAYDSYSKLTPKQLAALQSIHRQWCKDEY